MSNYPVRFHVDRPERYTRIQLAIRLALFALLGLVGISLGAVFWLAYLVFPVIAAVRLSGDVDRTRFLEESGPRIERALRWLASIYAYFGLVTDRLTLDAPDPAVHLEIARGGSADARGALVRILTGLPSALVLALLTFFGGLVWLVTAVEILISGQPGEAPLRYLEGIERWMLRLLAYQACLVDEYPPFTLGETHEAPIASAHG